MDHPVHQVPGVIAALCQGTRDEQEKALNDYFLPNAYFIHPFCRVPSINTFTVPFLGIPLNSRWLLSMIYQWYRILSPKIDFHVDSAGTSTCAILQIK